MSRKITMAIAGMHIESGTFSPLRSRMGDFLALRGDEMLTRYPFLADKEFTEIEAFPLVHFRAMPGGMIVREDYETMKQEILDCLRALEKMPLQRCLKEASNSGNPPFFFSGGGEGG